MRESLCGSGKRSFGREPRGEFRQHSQINVKSDALNMPDAQREHRALVFEPTELPLDSATAPVELPRASGVTGGLADAVEKP
jgi:hypothetical protein